MEWLNYHHLLYFWALAKEGNLARASASLRLAQSTVSGQIRALERSLGEKLFVKHGRSLALTDVGRVVYRYAEEIFAIGSELQDALKGQPVGRPLSLNVGVADVVPKRIAMRLIEPALRLAQPVRLICREDKPERLLGDLATHSLDVVLTDAPMAPSSRIKAFDHLLGECKIVFFAVAKLAPAYKRRFPASLDGAPLLLPGDNTNLRRSLDQWFAARGIHPKIVGEFDDSALLTVFGQSGFGIFAVPSVVADEVAGQAPVRPIGEVEEIRERFYAITVERRLKHPAVVAISNEAKNKLFAWQAQPQPLQKRKPQKRRATRN